MKKKNGKGDEFKLAEKEALEHEIDQLKFYGQSYIRSAMQTIAYAVPQLANYVRGSSSKLCKILQLLEQVAVATEDLAAQLQSQLSNALTKEESEMAKKKTSVTSEASASPRLCVKKPTTKE